MPQDFEKFRSNKNNYKLGVIYYCPEDPCLVLPKRIPGLGWTINFAHRYALLALVLSVVLATGPALVIVGLALARRLDLATALIGVPVVIAASVALTVFLSVRLSNRPL